MSSRRVVCLLECLWKCLGRACPSDSSTFLAFFLRMTGCFILEGELREDLQSLGHDHVRDPVILFCLSQIQLTDQGYENPSSSKTSRVANDRSSPPSCRAGKSPRHVHGPPVPGDLDFRRAEDSLLPNIDLAKDLEQISKMLRIMEEAKGEMLGPLNGLSLKKRLARADEDEEDFTGKIQSELRAIGRTLRPIDNNVVAGDSFKPASLVPQNLKGGNLVIELPVACSLNELSESTKNSVVGDAIKSLSVNTQNTKKENHAVDPPVATFDSLESNQPAVIADFFEPSIVTAGKMKSGSQLEESPVVVSENEVSQITESPNLEEEDKSVELDTCHEQMSRGTSSDHDVTALICKSGIESSRQLIEEIDTLLGINKALNHPEKEGASTDAEEEKAASVACLSDADNEGTTDLTSVSTTAVEQNLSAAESNSEGCGNSSSGSFTENAQRHTDTGFGDRITEDWTTRNRRPETLLEEKIIEDAIKAGASYFQDGVVYRENLIYDMLRSPDLGSLDDLLDSNHDLEEFQKATPVKKKRSPASVDLLSLSNDHFLEAFERSLNELDPNDTIDQETFASVHRQSVEPVFHQFNFSALQPLRIEHQSPLSLSIAEEKELRLGIGMENSSPLRMKDESPSALGSEGESPVSLRKEDENPFALRTEDKSPLSLRTEDENALSLHTEEETLLFLGTEDEHLLSLRTEDENPFDVEVPVLPTTDLGPAVMSPMNDRSNIPADGAEEMKERRSEEEVVRSRARPKTITDFFDPSEMTLRRPSVVELKKKDRGEFRTRQRSFGGLQDELDFRFSGLPPTPLPNRRHSLTGNFERRQSLGGNVSPGVPLPNQSRSREEFNSRLNIGGLGLTPLKVPGQRKSSEGRAFGTASHQKSPYGRMDGSSLRKSGDFSPFGSAGSGSPYSKSESGSFRKNGEGSPFGMSGSKSPLPKVHSGFLKKGGGTTPGIPSSRSPHGTLATSSNASGSEGSQKLNTSMRRSNATTSLLAREKSESSSMAFKSTRLSTSMQMPSEVFSNQSYQRQNYLRSTSEGLQRKTATAQNSKKSAGTPAVKPLSPSTSSHIPRTRASTEKLAPGEVRRTVPVDRVTTR